MRNITIDKTLIDSLLHKAAENPRLRANFDLRNSSDDSSQRMLNALLPGTDIPIHRHTDTDETVVIIKGAITEIFYDNDGNEESRTLISHNVGTFGIQIPQNQWHSIEVHQPSVIIECKDGRYEPIKQSDILTLS